MKTVHGRKVKVECWREYSWDPDCLGCWMWTCPCHHICERGRGIEMMLKAAAHIRKYHPSKRPVLD